MNFDIILKEDMLKVCAGAIFKSMEKAMDECAAISRVALGFHHAVADVILRVCEAIKGEKQINQVVLTGGVFQNKILMERTLHLLRNAGFLCYYNVSAGPNDGGICLGQNYLGMLYLNDQKHGDQRKGDWE